MATSAGRRRARARVQGEGITRPPAPRMLRVSPGGARDARGTWGMLGPMRIAPRPLTLWLALACVAGCAADGAVGDAGGAAHASSIGLSLGVADRDGSARVVGYETAELRERGRASRLDTCF